jgi:lipopolysaccharide/colanic/teichoic acid biosynthesis glycosyltransferase
MTTVARRPPRPGEAAARPPAERIRHLVWQDRLLLLPGADRPIVHTVKRVLDLVLAAVLLVLLAPAMLAIAAAVALGSRGPVLYRQERWGARRRRTPDGGVAWEARVFRCLKFRTMVRRADEAAHARHVRAFVRGELDRGGGSFKLEGDGRVTRVGRMLRRTSLDELPQLVNVIRGEMSLVGPRPVPCYEVESYPGEWCLGRLGARPGITGLWQVHGRSVVSFEEMILMDLDYVARPSLGRDLGLLLLTVPAVLRRRGAG